MDFHNPADNWQPQAGSLARRFGCEKRFKHLPGVLRHNAVAGIINFNRHPHRSIVVGKARGGRASPYSDRAAGRHRLYRIEKKVHEHMLDARAIQQQRRQGRVEFTHYRHTLFVQLMPHQRERIFDHAMNVLIRAPQRARPRIIKQHVDDAARAMDGFFHVLDQLCFARVFGTAIQEVIRPQTQRHERILEFMCDPSGQQTYGFHLCRFHELDLRSLQFRVNLPDVDECVTEILLSPAPFSILSLKRLGPTGHSLLQTFVCLAHRR